MYKLTLAFVSLFFLFSAPASAGADNQKWVVTQLSGDARVVRPGLQPASLSVRAQLSPGDRLVTGPTGRATLVKGADYIVVAPRSEMRIPSAAQPSGFTRVVQTLGTLLFKVQHTGVPHFAVDTPMLAAVVKGTTFTVTVDQQRSAIQVTQGLVQVSAVDGGMTRMVEGGKTVFVNHAAPKVLLDADKPSPASPSPSATSVTVAAEIDAPLAAIATLTDGLVRAELTAQPSLVTASTPVATPVTETVRATPTARPAVTTAAVSTSAAASTASNVTVSTSVSTPATAPVSATVAVSTTAVVAAPTSVVTIAATAPTVTAAVTTPIISTSTATITAPMVTPTAVTTPAATVPEVTTPIVSTSPVTLPTVTIASNTAPSVTVAPISTPTATAPAITTPIAPSTSPTIIVPAITTPTVTVPSILSGL